MWTKQLDHSFPPFNKSSEEAQEQAAKAIKEDAVEVILDNHLGTTEVCPVRMIKTFLFEYQGIWVLVAITVTGVILCVA